MEAGKLMLRMALAALLSGAAAGLLLTLAVPFAFWLLDPRAGWTAADSFLPLPLARALPFAIWAGLLVATLPAFLAGALMWALAARSEAAASPAAWAAAGAGVGGALLALVYVTLSGAADGLELGRTDAALLAAFLAAGAGTALVFRGVMRLSGRLSVDGGEAA